MVKSNPVRRYAHSPAFGNVYALIREPNCSLRVMENPSLTAFICVYRTYTVSTIRFLEFNLIFNRFVELLKLNASRLNLNSAQHLDKI